MNWRSTLAAILWLGGILSSGVHGQCIGIDLSDTQDAVIINWDVATNAYIITHTSDLSLEFQTIQSATGVVEQSTRVPMPVDDTGFFSVRYGLIVVNVDDPVLDAFIRSGISSKLVPTNAIYQVEVNTNQNLNLDFQPVSSLAGVEWMVALTNIDASFTLIDELNSIHLPSQLVSVTLFDSELLDLHVSNSLPLLTTLDVAGNMITNISSLEGAAALIDLNLNGNQLSQASELSGLTNLVVLDMGDNNVTNIAGLAGLDSLENVFLNDNPLLDIESLAGLTNMVELDLSQTLVTNIQSLITNAVNGGLGTGDTVFLLNTTAQITNQVNTLRGFGTTVFYP